MTMAAETRDLGGHRHAGMGVDADERGDTCRGGASCCVWAMRGAPSVRPQG